MRLNNLHVVVSSVAAIAGVTIAAYQAFGPAPQVAQPVQVTVALEQNVESEDVGLKEDGGPSLATDAVALERNALVSSALKDGSEERYDFRKLFDGDPESSLTIKPPDSEINVLVSFGMQRSYPVTAIRYTPPAGVDPETMARTLDVMVLPEGQLEASGRPVMSFTLQRSTDSQTFAIPGHAVGKAVWLRVSGGDEGQPVKVGDFSILREQLVP